MKFARIVIRRKFAWFVALLALASSPTCLARSAWTTLENCRYLIKRSNDGDSFHVSVSGKEYIFRLYFVDAPETNTEFPARIKTQANYFGLTDDQTVKLGELAKAFSREKLTRPFVVRTCWQDAMGRSRMQRFFAFIQTYNGDLGEQLVENGLARRYGAKAKPSETSTSRQEWLKLENLEEKAKREKVGGWGIKAGLQPARAANAQSEKGIDPFTAFFHPKKNAATNAEADSSNTPLPLTSYSFSAATKLDVNNASQTDLENIPGIGHAMAQRIVAARPFKNADDLKNVKGIGSGKKYEKIRPYFN